MIKMKRLYCELKLISKYQVLEIENDKQMEN